MAPCLDFALASLLCEENNDCISYDNGDDIDDMNINQSHDKNQNLKMKDETEYSVLDLPLQNDARLSFLSEKEHEQIVGFVDYLDKLKNQDLFFVARQQAVDWILKVCLIFYDLGLES